MIQRVQTLWMILAAIAIFLTLQLSFYSGTLIADNAYHHLIPTENNMFIMVLTSALGSAIVINIFLFRYRSLQTKICLAAIFLELLILLLYFLQLKNYSSGTFSLWSVLHFVTLVSIIMALISIRKDDKLVKDSNRLR